jgi:hypothetical protein
MERIGTEKCGARKSAHEIIERLNIAGAIAGIKKDLRELRVPSARAARLMKIRKGNIILRSFIVNANFSG